jgi:hypothetical protein
MYNIIMGHRALTLATGVNAAANLVMGKELQGRWRKYVNMGDMIWREIIKYAKVTQVIRLPDILLGNVYSNMQMALVDGIKFSFQYKKAKEALYAMNRYMQLNDRASKLRFEIMRTKSPEKKERLEGDLRRLRLQMDNSSVGLLVRDGLFSPIVEDIETGEVDPRQEPIGNAFQWGWAKVKQGAQAVGIPESTAQSGIDTIKNIQVLPGSTLFNLAMKGTQLSDFVGRYIKFTWDTEVQKMPVNEAVERAVNQFVYYRQPSNRWVKAINDYGVVMFTKFFFASQHIAAGMFMERPASMITAHALNTLAGNPNHISHYFMNTDTLWERLDPVAVLDFRPFGEVAPALEWIPNPIPFTTN